MTLAPLPAEGEADEASDRDAAEGAALAQLVGNPRRTRGIDASILTPARPVTSMVGNPRRTRGIDPTLLAAG